MKWISGIVIFLVIAAFSGINSELRTFPFRTLPLNEVVWNTTLSETGDIVMVTDSQGLPLFYYQKVFTGVCMDNVCKPADLYLFWDASGSFLGFDIPNDVPLTKKGHKEFSKLDYYLLFTILNNPYSNLGKVKYEELVARVPGNNNGLDAVSGATIISGKHTIVPGAVFTCFTLWHLVNDNKVTTAIQNKSIELLPVSYNDKKTDYKAILQNAGQMSAGELALWLSKAEKDKKLKKLTYQRLVTDHLNQLSPLHALIINNYINRQVFVFPEIENRLSKCSANEKSFLKMIP